MSDSMMPTSAEPAAALNALHRLLLALLISIGIHGMVLVLVQARPPVASAGPVPVLSAWIERVIEHAEPVKPPASIEPDATEAQPPDQQTSAPAADATPRELPREIVAAPRVQAAQTSKQDPQPGIDVPLERDPIYYPASALDKLPNLLGEPNVCLPVGASGEVVYELLIDENGTVSEASIKQVRPVGLFVLPAEEGCRALKFTPAERAGRAVKSRVRFVIRSED